jgi:hypothetical protein
MEHYNIAGVICSSWVRLSGTVSVRIEGTLHSRHIDECARELRAASQCLALRDHCRERPNKILLVTEHTVLYLPCKASRDARTAAVTATGLDERLTTPCHISSL